jgi:predicted O-methyltransferase YrrM
MNLRGSKAFKNLMPTLQRVAAASSRSQREPAMRALMTVYENRPDLQEVYPEAQEGNLGRLILWASGVSGRQWTDSSYLDLRPYATWYFANRESVEHETPVPWDVAEGTSKASANPLPVTVAAMRDPNSSDISLHLPLLALLVREFDLKAIVELGTRNGNSTIALLEAATAIGGQVLSVDVEPCLDARRRIKEAGFDSMWQFVQADDMSLGPPIVPVPIDLLFIDTSHIYSHTIAELNKYYSYLRDGSWIVMHDYVEFPGVNRAVREFVEKMSQSASFYPFVHQNGLAVMRVTKPKATKAA